MWSHCNRDRYNHSRYNRKRYTRDHGRSSFTITLNAPKMIHNKQIFAFPFQLAFFGPSVKVFSDYFYRN
jgi:hypothetical protein